MGKVVSTRQAPNPIGPYSQAVRGGRCQIPVDPDTQQIIDGDVRQQTEPCWRIFAEILEAAGSGMSKVVRCGVFMKNMSDFEAMNEVFGKTFGPRPPARTTVEAARLPKDSLLESDAIA
jgi:2-iminobutanoate/2-iminopropanoate deaminase